MENTGDNALELQALVEHVALDSDGRRITIPKQFADRMRWDADGKAITRWLWFVSPGRYRLLSDDQVGTDPQLDTFRSLMLEEWPKPSTTATSVQPPEITAAVARLVRVEVKTNKSYWRLSLPVEFDPFIPDDCDRKALTVLVSPEGYLEVWYKDVLRNAILSSPVTRK
jgi:hypothetical protein